MSGTAGWAAGPGRSAGYSDKPAAAEQLGVKMTPWRPRSGSAAESERRHGAARCCADASLPASPYGQMPALARNNVDLPAPDGPVTKVRSLPLMLRWSVATSGVPLGKETRSCSRSMLLLPPDDMTSIEPGPVG